MTEHTPRFTMVFDGDLREFNGNPLKAITDWGPVQAAGIGDAFAENDTLLARIRELEEALKISEPWIGRISGSITDAINVREKVRAILNARG